MSVILENNQKFCDIFEALRRRPKVLKYFFYKPGEDKPLPIDSDLGLFVGQLHLANVASYNERYTNADEKPRSFDLAGTNSAGTRWTDLELIKALKSISYQCDEARVLMEHKFTLERLQELIYFLMSLIINKMPGYENAETW